MHVVIVKDRIRQAVEIVERADGLGQFFVQAVANFLRCHIGGHKDGRAVAAFQRGPIDLRRAAHLFKLFPARHSGHNETSGAWDGAG